MTPTQLTLEALMFIYASGGGGGVNQATIALASAPQLSRIAYDLTASAQESYDLCAAIYRRTVGFTLLAPRSITLSVTDGSSTVTTGDTFTEGATVYVGGVYNQIFTENAVKKLLFPYGGTTGSATAMLYSDVMVLDATEAEVLNQVFIADGFRLYPAGNLQELRTLKVWNERDYGMGGSVGATSAPIVSTPRKYFAEDFLLTDGSNHVLTRRLRVHPLPDAITQISVLVKLRAPTFAVADLGTDGAPSTRTFVIPDNYQEAILRPLFLERWSGSPWFRDDAARAQIKEQAATARRMLVNKRTQQARPMRLTAPI